MAEGSIPRRRFLRGAAGAAGSGVTTVHYTRLIAKLWT